METRMPVGRRLDDRGLKVTAATSCTPAVLGSSVPRGFLFRAGHRGIALGGAVAGSMAFRETTIGGIRPETGSAVLRFATTDMVPSRLSLSRQAR
jgi:hypothetical protein